MSRNPPRHRAIIGCKLEITGKLEIKIRLTCFAPESSIPGIVYDMDIQVWWFMVLSIATESEFCNTMIAHPPQSFTGSEKVSGIISCG